MDGSAEFMVLTVVGIFTAMIVLLRFLARME